MVAPLTIGPGIDIGGGIIIGTPSAPNVLVIPLNDAGGLTGWSPQSASIPYSPTVISQFPIGSTITFQDNTTATIGFWDDYGPIYIDIFWDTPKTGDLFPITLTSV